MKGVLSDSCIFCKIIKGAIPSYKVFENDHVLAFLDINALSKGHTLVIPKHCAARTHELPEEFMGEVGKALQKVSKAIVEATGVPDYNILQNNGEAAHQAVFHVHYHIIPKQPNGAGLGIVWKSGNPEKDALEALAGDIKAKF